ncbi:hypothetical protein CVT26_000567 [Gymnopilus dilepis]|uniref:Uncharacterized protein n=1 Tax=Gymnopilus dilepis TaxID=231916 RepID=A0A409VHE5_9AGAR|nr:hypothetical protein CVT26_000567 [Gymnopilus dilepis]
MDPGTTYIDRLPNEILAIIFSAYISNPSRVPTCHPFVLGAASRYWRDITWTNSSFWSKLFIKFGESRNLTETRLELMEDWLGRSGKQPLWISISMAPLSDNEDLVPRLMRIINQHCDRWYDLRLKLPTRAFEYLGDTTLAPSTLHKLSISSSDRRHWAIDVPEMAKFRPSIVCIHGLCLNPTKLDWTSATSSSMSIITPDSAVEVLRLAENLRECSLTLVDIPASNSLQHVTHRHLQRLQICAKETGASETFFQHVTLPNVWHISWEGPRSAQLVYNTLPSFFARSSHRLRSLALSEPRYGETEFVDVFRVLPLLEEVHISHGSSDTHENLAPFFKAFQGNPSTIGTHQTSIYWVFEKLGEVPRLPGSVASSLRPHSKRIKFNLQIQKGKIAPVIYDIPLDG